MHQIRLRGAVRAAMACVLWSTASGSVSFAASPTKVLGSITGFVQDNSGIPQMGAAVKLYNRHEKLIEQALTDGSGNFSFLAVTPGLYTVRVNLSSFVPAVRKNIEIQPGMQSVLAINMATLLSSVELVYTSRNPGTLMSEDWKWVLRSTMTTRPVLRILPGVDIADPARRSVGESAVFSSTRGLLRVSSGENANPFASTSAQPDLGTTFALATSLYGRNQVQFSGNFGYNLNSDAPAAGFRTSFSRDGVGPEVKLTVQQVGLAPRGPVGLGQSFNSPALRTMSVTLLERRDITEDLEIDFGGSLESVTYLDRLHYFSPFARVRYKLAGGSLELGYSSGAPPIELLNSSSEDASLLNDVAALNMLPRVSLRDGRAHVQRTENMEIGYRKQIGSRTIGFAAYHELMRNAALTMSTPEGFYYPADLLPELSSNSSVFNIGNFSRSGVSASATQAFGDDYQVMIAAGSGGALTTDRTQLSSGNPDELRRQIEGAQRFWIRTMVSGLVPGAGTRVVASYEWTDATTLTPGHVYLTQTLYPETGLNFRIRQPIPARWSALRGRLEATAELRNLLAQGYLPITTTDGRRILLAHFPRAVRGGFSFIF